MPETALQLVGVITSDTPTDLGLSGAARRHVGLVTLPFTLEDAANDDVAGLVVDVPLEQRAETLKRLAKTWRVPMLVEAPAANSLLVLRPIAEAAGDRIVSANPVRYGLHTQRLLEQLRASGDALETFSAAWRFCGESLPGYALPQLVDYLAEVSPAGIERVSVLAREDPAIRVISERYASGVLGSVEIGTHLPASFPSASELIVECFCRLHVFHCAPANQAVSVYGATTQRMVDWQPQPSDAIVAAFADWLSGGPRPPGDVQRDLAAVELVERIADAALTHRVITFTN